MLVGLQAHMSLMTLLGLLPPCTFQCKLHHTRADLTLLHRSLRYTGSLILAR